MITGTKVHNQLEEKFQESATPATFDEVLEFSKTEKNSNQRNVCNFT